MLLSFVIKYLFFIIIIFNWLMIYYEWLWIFEGLGPRCYWQPWSIMPLWIYFHGEIISKAISCDRFRIGMIIFGSVRFLSKKVTKPKLFFFEKKPKPNRNRVKPTGFGSVRFFRAKTGSNRFGLVFPVFARFGSVFSGFGSVFSVWLGFSGLARFFVGFGLVRFGFLVIKPKRTGRFFQKFNRFNRFFFLFGFFDYYFSGFLDLIGFPIFLLTPRCQHCCGFFTMLKFTFDHAHLPPSNCFLPPKVLIALSTMTPAY